MSTMKETRTGVGKFKEGSCTALLRCLGSQVWKMEMLSLVLLVLNITLVRTRSTSQRYGEHEKASLCSLRPVLLLSHGPFNRHNVSLELLSRHIMREEVVKLLISTIFRLHR